MRTPRQRPQETRSSSPVRSLLFCLLVSSFVFFCQVFVLLRVCSELFRKDPLRILVLVPPCTPLHPSGHLRCRSLPSSTGPRSVTRVFRPVSGAVLRADIESRVPRVLVLQHPRRRSGPCLSSRYRPCHRSCPSPLASVTIKDSSCPSPLAPGCRGSLALAKDFLDP